MSALSARVLPRRFLYAVSRGKYLDSKQEVGQRCFTNLCQHEVCKRQIHVSPKQSVSIGSFNSDNQTEDVEPIGHVYATPREIKEYLDRHVVGQEQAKTRLAVTAYYHKKIVEHNVSKLRPPKWKGVADIHDAAIKSLDTADSRDSFSPFSADDIDDIVLEKGNIIMLGPSGSGKTLLARTLANVLKVPFAEWDCTSLTSPGYVGDDVSDIISRLLQNANWDVSKCEQGIVFLDEVDKIARKTAEFSNTKDINGEGVQLTLLKMLEGTQIKVKNKEGNQQLVDTTNILFVLAGAFNGIDDIVKRRTNSKAFGLGAPVPGTTAPKEDKVDILNLYEGQSALEKNQESDNFISMVEADDLRNFGLIPEFVGRIPNIVTLHSIDEDALVRILTEPEASFVKQYKFSFELDDCQLEITDEALRAIAKVAIENRTGARSLGSILESILMMPAYEVPQSNIKKVIITEDVVRKKSQATYVYDETVEDEGAKKKTV